MPAAGDRKRRIQEAEREPMGRDIAEEVHRELRRLGGVQPPREFVFMDRAAVGLGSVFMHLKAEINWHRLFHELIADFDLKVAERQSKALAAAKVPGAAGEEAQAPLGSDPFRSNQRASFDYALRAPLRMRKVVQRSSS